MSAQSVEVAIIGGGIGGLTTAVALNRAGIDAHVYEQADAYGDIGGHLTIDDAGGLMKALAKFRAFYRKCR